MRAVLAEDSSLLRDGLSRLLGAYGFEVVAAFADGEGLAEQLIALRPDVAVIDVRLPPTFTDEGLRATVTARRAVSGLPVLILSQHVEPLYASELLSDRAGGIGYLLKDRVGEVTEFIDAVSRVAAGGTAMDREVITELIDARRGPRPLDDLTPRELEVLCVMAEGRSNAAIAAALVITEKAVSKHINSIFAKLALPPSESDHRRVLAVLTYLAQSSANPRSV